METSTHSQGAKSETKVEHGVNATWIYNAGHEDEGDEEEEWDSPLVASARKNVRGGASEQEDKKEEEGDSETGEVHRELTNQNCLQTFKDIKDNKGFAIPGDDGITLERRIGEKHIFAQQRSSISGQVSLQYFKDINDDKGFDLSGDGFKKDTSPKWPSNLAPENPARKLLQKRSGAKHKRDKLRSSIKDALKNLDI
jgi:hypothetical protein